MSKYILYSHFNSGNRGCEAITRSTIKLLGISRNDVCVISDDYSADIECGLESIARIVPIRSTKGIDRIHYVPYYLLSKCLISPHASIKYKYDSVMYKEIDKDGIAISTGGDLYCYSEYSRLSYFSDVVRRIGAYNVLWGCTIDEKMINDKLIKELGKYDLITTRDKKSFETVKNLNLKSKLDYVPDTAFVLEPQEWNADNYTDAIETIGINISNFVINNKAFYRALIELIKYILKETDSDIILVPHVFWRMQNDILINERIKKEFEKEKRVKTVTERLNCQQLKFLISKFDYYMGARTHSMIAAYSSCVPSVAFGYSVKAKYIADDLEIPKEFVIDGISDMDSMELIRRYKMMRETDLRSHLNVVVPDIKNRVLKAKKLLV